jgi:S1-C subfamily serine protease
MKRLLAMAFAAWSVSALGDGWPSVQFDGKHLTNITKAYIGAGGKIIIITSGGGASTTADKLPKDFLTSWGITSEQQEAAKAKTEKKNADDLERAILAGAFREADGVVYDTRKPQSGWLTFRNVKVVQVLYDGAILDVDPAIYNATGIYVKGLTTVADTDYVTITVKPAGSYSYINKIGNDRTIRAYDLGRPCRRSEIPEAVLLGKKTFDFTFNAGEHHKNALDILPESDDINSSGTAFFITEDGYLITNWHVVSDAKRIKVKNSLGVFDAQVVKTHKEHDLALLKAQGMFNALSISTNDASLGEAVFTIGFPNIELQGTEPKYTDGKISSLQGFQDDPVRYQISVPVQPGNSGGPLVDSAGLVKGVVVSRLGDLAALRATGTLPQNVNYAVKAKCLREFLATAPEVKFTEPKAQSSSIVQSAQNAVAIVLVY